MKTECSYGFLGSVNLVVVPSKHKEAISFLGGEVKLHNENELIVSWSLCDGKMKCGDSVNIWSRRKGLVLEHCDGKRTVSKTYGVNELETLAQGGSL